MRSVGNTVPTRSPAPTIPRRRRFMTFLSMASSYGKGPGDWRHGSVEIRHRAGRACETPGHGEIVSGAGIDLALAWVEEDCGAGLAHEAARELVLFLRRPGWTAASERLTRLTGFGDDVDS